MTFLKETSKTTGLAARRRNGGKSGSSRHGGCPALARSRRPRTARCRTYGVMKNDKRQTRQGRPDSAPPDFRTVGFDFEPGPTAETRR